MLYTLRVAVMALLPLLLLIQTAKSEVTINDVLTYAVIDQKSPGDEQLDEGLIMVVQDKAEWASLTSETPLGQTFTVGPDADTLWRITVGLCHWPDAWIEGESVTFTLYDGPEKNNVLYTRTIDYSQKWFKWDTPFDINIPIEPETEYYFELTHNGGGDNQINVTSVQGNRYERGQAYIAGEAQPDLDLTFVVITKPEGDEQANLRRFISRFDLDHPTLEKAKDIYASGDLMATALEIANSVGEYLQEAEWITHPGPDTQFNTSRMNRVVDEGRLYRSSQDRQSEWIPMGPETTWREVWPGSADYVRHNDLFNDLGWAYAVTSDDKYVEKLDELMVDLVQDNTSPFEGGMRGGHRVAMFQAWRLGDAWNGYALSLASDKISDAARIGWLDYKARMAHFAYTEPSGGNHANAVAEALLQFAERFPMYADARTWFSGGFELLVNNTLSLFYTDGACREPTMNYHGYSLATLLAGLNTAERFGYDAPPPLQERLERALVFTGYMLKPSGAIPSNGDTNTQEWRPDREIWDGWRNKESRLGYEMFGREDLLWIATRGAEGIIPDNPLKGTEYEARAKTGPSASYRFPVSGYSIMRSDWGEDGQEFTDARWLLHYGHHFGSHGHWDLNHITVYAYGRPLLIDPGRTTYGTPLMFELESNRSHNVLLCDDQNMNRVGPTLNSWQTSPVMDFIDSTRENLYNGVDHQRAIVFVRPDYWVMFDRVKGENPHRYGLNFWLTPPDVTIDQNRGFVRSNEPNGSNILLQAVNPSGLEIAHRHGTTDLGGIVDDVPVVTYVREGQANASFSTVLYPYPEWTQMSPLEVQQTMSGGTEIVKVEVHGGTDFVFYHSGEGEYVTEGSNAFRGRAGLVRTSDGENITAFSIADGNLISLGNQRLAWGADAIENLSVTYTSDTVEVVSADVLPGLQIATLGRSKADVNGQERSISGDSFIVWAGALNFQ